MASVRFPWSVLFAPHAPHVHINAHVCVQIRVNARLCNGAKEVVAKVTSSVAKNDKFLNTLRDYMNFHLDQSNESGILQDWEIYFDANIYLDFEYRSFILNIINVIIIQW